jgi:hypothetical protein
MQTHTQHTLKCECKKKERKENDEGTITNFMLLEYVFMREEKRKQEVFLEVRKLMVLLLVVFMLAKKKHTIQRVSKIF